MEEVSIGTVCNQMNVGHIRQMKLVAASDFLKLDVPVCGINMYYSEMQLNSSAKIYSCDFFRKEAKFSEKQNLSGAGVEFEFGLDFSWRSNPEMVDFLYQNQNKRWVLFFTDLNGQSYFAGSVDQPLKLSFGRMIEAFNFLKVNISGKSWHPVFFIDSLNVLEMLQTQVIDLRKYAMIDFKVVEGDTVNEPLTFRDANGNIENLTGCSFKMQLRRADGTIVTSFVMGTGFTLQSGNTELLMYKSDVIPAGDYVYDLQRTNPDKTVDTVLKGNFIVESQITT